MSPVIDLGYRTGETRISRFLTAVTGIIVFDFTGFRRGKRVEKKFPSAPDGCFYTSIDRKLNAGGDAYSRFSRCSLKNVTEQLCENYEIYGSSLRKKIKTWQILVEFRAPPVPDRFSKEFRHVTALLVRKYNSSLRRGYFGLFQKFLKMSTGLLRS